MDWTAARRASVSLACPAHREEVAGLGGRPAFIFTDTPCPARAGPPLAGPPRAAPRLPGGPAAAVEAAAGTAGSGGQRTADSG